MRACAAATVQADALAGARPTLLRSRPPLVLRWTRDGLMLVGGAGGPLGGDDLELRLQVADGARLRAGSAAAMVVQPGRSGAAASLTVAATVGERAVLRWAPEPVVVTAGAALNADTRIECAPGGTVSWREMIVLGRHDEKPGDVVSRLRVTVGGTPVLHQETRLGPGAPGGWAGPAVTAGCRVLALHLVRGPAAEADPSLVARPSRRPPPTAFSASMRLEEGGLLVTAMADSTLAARRALDWELTRTPAGESGSEHQFTHKSQRG